MKKILFLYTEIASYFVACLHELVQNHEVEVHLVRWPINPEAPFKFEIDSKIKVYERKEHTTEQLITLYEIISPDLVFSSGWMDKGYVAVCKHINKSVPVLVGMDNQWVGSFRQQMATVISPFTIRKYFSHAWVAGQPQKVYAQKLGFADNKIMTGYYSADYEHFTNLFRKHQEAKEQNFPKKFLYVGRYIPHKGIVDLWNAFIALQAESPNEWELWCLGTGELEATATKHPKIKHFGFVQPKDMEEFIAQTGVSILPSHYEPWGVVVHEFAAAGFPLLCSKKVGAATKFLKEGENGYYFQHGNVEELKEAMKKIVEMPNTQLWKMALKSQKLAQEITPAKWAKSIMTVED